MQKEFRPSWAGWFWLILFTFGFAIPYVWWRRRGVRYEITDSRVIRHTGRLSSSIEEFRLNKGMAATRIETNQSLSEKIFGAGSITIEAGADEMTLKSVPNHKRIAKQIRELQD